MRIRHRRRLARLKCYVGSRKRQSVLDRVAVTPLNPMRRDFLGITTVWNHSAKKMIPGAGGTSRFFFDLGAYESRQVI